MARSGLGQVMLKWNQAFLVDARTGPPSRASQWLLRLNREWTDRDHPAAAVLLGAVGERATDRILLGRGFERYSGPSARPNGDRARARGAAEALDELFAQLRRNRIAAGAEEPDGLHGRGNRQDNRVVERDDHAWNAGIATAPFKGPAHGFFGACLAEIEPELALRRVENPFCAPQRAFRL